MQEADFATVAAKRRVKALFSRKRVVQDRNPLIFRFALWSGTQGNTISGSLRMCQRALAKPPLRHAMKSLSYEHNSATIVNLVNLVFSVRRITDRIIIHGL